MKKFTILENFWREDKMKNNWKRDSYKRRDEEAVELRKTKSCPKVRKKVTKCVEEKWGEDYTGLGKMDKQTIFYR